MDLCDDKSDSQLLSETLRSETTQSSTAARLLTPDEEALLRRQSLRPIPERKQQLLEVEARKHWDVFYKRNSTKFFKDRHWTTREFEELTGTDALLDGNKRTILEVGCGVGNFMFPLLNEMSDIFFYACDFSPRAVQFVKDNEQFDADRCSAFCCDVTSEPLDQHVPASSVDFATLIFCLSAIHPDKMVPALVNICTILRPGGCVLFRDYGLYDHAMLRFTPGHKLADNFYVRQDGTRAYYFSLEKLDELFTSAGFQTAKAEYIFRETINRKEGLCVPRVFVQGKFTKSTFAINDKT